MPKVIPIEYHPTENLSYNQRMAAKILGISPKTLQRETAKGLIHKTTIGLYSREEMQKYLRRTLVR